MKALTISFIIIYLIALLGYLIVETSENFKKRAINKILLSSLFTLYSTLCFFKNPVNWQKGILLVGIFFCFIGDVLLLWSLRKGGKAFIVGNIFITIYMLIQLSIYRISLLWYLGLFLVIFGIYWGLVQRKILVLGNMSDFTFYMLSIIAHGSLGLTMMLKTTTLSSQMLGVGLVLFMISDFFLAFYNFHKKVNLILRLNSAFYFIGLMLISLYMGI